MRKVLILFRSQTAVIPSAFTESIKGYKKLLCPTALVK